MQLERVLIVVEARSQPDGRFPDFDIRHIEAPLRITAIVKNIDIFYYQDYGQGCDDALVTYCSRSKPQAILLSIQNLALRPLVGPSPSALRTLRDQMNIPTVIMWSDIAEESIAKVFERYARAATLNVIWDSNRHSHRLIPLKGVRHCYAPITFDETLFDLPESTRDIPVGFIGLLNRNRGEWVAALQNSKLPVHIVGRTESPGCFAPVSGWTSYEGYIQQLFRFKIALSFSSSILTGHGPGREPRWGRPIEAASKAKVAMMAARYLGSDPGYFFALLGDIFAPPRPRYQIRARAWEALWSRCLLMEEDNPVTAIYLKPYADYVPFTSVSDLVDKAKFYLENEGEYNRIRLNGHDTVKKYYSSKVYWECIFRAVGLEGGGQQQFPGEIWNKGYFAERLSASV